MRWRAPAGYGGGASAAEDLAARLEVLAGVAGRREASAELATPAAVVEAAPAVAEAATAAGSRGDAPLAVPAQAQARLEPPQAQEITPTDVPFRRDAAAQTARPRPRKALEAKIFVAPRAPDDPGTGASDIDDLRGYPTKA